MKMIITTKCQHTAIFETNKQQIEKKSSTYWSKFYLNTTKIDCILQYNVIDMSCTPYTILLLQSLVIFIFIFLLLFFMRLKRMILSVVNFQLITIVFNKPLLYTRLGRLNIADTIYLATKEAKKTRYNKFKNDVESSPTEQMKYRVRCTNRFNYFFPDSSFPPS